MITVYIEDADYITQKSYDSIISELNIRDLTCTCGNCRCLIHHGGYKRKLKAPDGEYRLRINRVKCTSCGCTHALLVSSIIPYSQISLKDQLKIINCFESRSGYAQILASNLSLDENAVRAVALRYRRAWKEYALIDDIPTFSSELSVKYCFQLFKGSSCRSKELPIFFLHFPHNFTG